MNEKELYQQTFSLKKTRGTTQFFKKGLLQQVQAVGGKMPPINLISLAASEYQKTLGAMKTPSIIE